MLAESVVPEGDRTKPTTPEILEDTDTAGRYRRKDRVPIAR